TVPAQVSGALVVADPLLATKVQQVIQHPVAQQRPDLQHFALTDSAKRRAPRDAGALLDGSSVFEDPLVITAALAAVLLACAAWQLWMSSRPKRTRIVAVLSTAVFGPVLAAGALTTGT